MSQKITYPLFSALHLFFSIVSNVSTHMSIVFRGWKCVAGLKVRPDDIFLCTYPKSGTTWLQMIMYQLTTDGDMDKITHLSDAVPHVELTRVDLEKMPSPRVIKTHLYYPQLPKGARYIYVLRNGMDVAHSYYHHSQLFLNETGDFNSFYQRFIQGRVNYGSWFKHVRDWLNRKDNPNIFVITYEELIADREGSIKRIAEFCKIKLTDEILDRTLERSSFEYMKKVQEKVDLQTHFFPPKPLKFLRSGKSGTGESKLTPEQLAAYKTAMDQHLKGYGLDAYMPGEGA